jgi:hypothetical protein
MSSPKRIPTHHRVIVEAAVKAALGERAVVREIVEMQGGPSLRVRVGALHCGIYTFWSRWTGRHQKSEFDGR